MAKLAKLMNQVASLKGQLSMCNQAYIDLYNKYNKLVQKYSYQEAMEEVKKIDKDRNVNKKLLL